MKPIKKYLKVALTISFCSLLLLFLINAFDDSLNSQTSEVLNLATNTNGSEDIKCAAMLGLVVAPNLDSVAEGSKVLEKIKASAKENTKFEKLLAPNEIKRIESKEKCQSECRYSTTERQRLHEEINQQRVFLNRFEKVMDLGNVQCQIPEVIFRIPLSGYVTLAKNKILEYKLMAEQGQKKDALIGLKKMNQFVEQSLSAEKYPMLLGMINISILQNVREALNSLEQSNKNALQFKDFKYEDIARHMQTGELQLITFLLKKPIDYRFFEITDINQCKILGANKYISFMQAAIDKLTNYFYLPNETTNEMFNNLQVAAWHPCIGQKDISCNVNSPYYFTWIRNPVGKGLTRLMTSNLAHTFQKLKTKIENLNKFVSTNAKESAKKSM